MAQPVIVQAFKSLILDMIGEILYFPLWWYSRGLLNIGHYFINSIKNSNRNLALTLLLKNIFQPMFGVQDRSGRIISLFMRLLLVLMRAVFFIGLLIFYILVVVFWLALPVIVVFGLYYNISSLWRR